MRVVGGTTKQLDGSVGIEFAQLFPPYAFQVRARKLPGINPTLGHRNLLRRPTSEGRMVCFHTGEDNRKTLR